jgi:hypothetical protein
MTSNMMTAVVVEKNVEATSSSDAVGNINFVTENRLRLFGYMRTI